ncbi:MAG: endolytic transglycosylase MltG [Chloroflexota bacterium]
MVGVVLIVATVGVFFGILSLVTGNLPQSVVDLVLQGVEAAPSKDASEVTFVVREGESAGQIATRLEQERLISNALVFRLVARSRGEDSGIAAGEHRLRRNMSMPEILAAMQKAAPRSQLVVLEGWRAAEIADEVEVRGLSSKSEFMSMVQNEQWDYAFLRGRPAGATLEGYLFPDTYALNTTLTGRDLITRMLDDFESRVSAAWQQRAPDLNLSLHQAVTLASIVEREARVPAERPLIAGVYLNRLRNGMLLQADPTVQYAAAPASTRPAGGYWKQDLTIADLALTSPYNTYRSQGLPPGPICSPGLASLRAAFNPTETDYLYFVAKGDGSHAFAKTLAEHDANVLKYGQ